MDDPIERWHAFLVTRESAILDGLLAEDVVFESPVVFTPQRGKAIVTAYLRAATQLLGVESFRYRNTWRSESSAVLEFEVVLDAIAVNGVDIIAWNHDGRITQFKVMLRPLQAVNIVHAKMREMLSRARP
jgi:ketosteroid isomerase-like protein